MQSKSPSRILMIAMAAMIVFVLAGSSAMAQSETATSGDRRCSNRTLLGNYASQIEGTILGPNLPLRGLAMAHFDGKGNITQVDHIVVNGVPPAVEWSPGTGTYSVNPDCTGSAVINSSSALCGGSAWHGNPSSC